jgi:hypothetical protein
MTPFKFDQKYYVFKDDILDLSVINAQVPPPDAQVDIEVALVEWKRDLRNVHDIYLMGGRPNIEGNWKIILNRRDWSRFWSIRHPNAAVREQEKLVLYACDASIDRITEKARSCLQRRMQGP